MTSNVRHGKDDPHEKILSRFLDSEDQICQHHFRDTLVSPTFSLKGRQGRRMCLENLGKYKYGVLFSEI